LKHVEDALYEAKIHGVIPQRVDERTLRIPIPKCVFLDLRALVFLFPHFHLSRPTVEARLAAYSTASKKAEEARVQIRRQHQASVKKGKYSRHSIAHDEVRAFPFPFHLNMIVMSVTRFSVPEAARPPHCRRGYRFGTSQKEFGRTVKYRIRRFSIDTQLGATIHTFCWLINISLSDYGKYKNGS
jgi:hypothetical protein